ncbi:MAG: hypothetical protein J3Q66DRAFT_384536 [Benniella sp.]|nr:MAG: hypothetical protein J3Q66DRAFT_384536 [Benniella sp.]
MLATFFSAAASILLSIMIINANEPVIDYSHLSKPTATFPPAPVPAPVQQDTLMAPPPAAALGTMVSMERGSFLQFYWKISSSSIFSPGRSWRRRIMGTRSQHHHHHGHGHGHESTATKWLKQQQQLREKKGHEQEERTRDETPQKSRYSPPAAYSEYAVESYDQQQQQQQQQQQRFNKSGFCATERWSSRQSSSQLEDWKSHMPIVAQAIVKT